jgi:hypothetical protein
VMDLAAIADTVARIRRSSFRVIGTDREESMRAFAVALVRGASLRVNRYLESGSMLLAQGDIYFASEADRAAFLREVCHA